MHTPDEQAADTGAAFPALAPTDRCPCGLGEEFAACCHRLLAGAPAPSAEALMRSRYTAFVVGDGHYVLATWHPDTRPPRLSLDPADRWVDLHILDRAAGGPFDTEGTVEFVARYIDAAGNRGRLHERSRFAKIDGRWWYLGGTEAPAH